jgi:starvation-inducible DNA-binding protein
MNPTRNDLSASVRTKVCELLNARLADLIDMQSQVKQAHWNVKGPAFIAIHELFDDISGNLIEHIDTVAERAAQLGGQVMGTARIAAAASTLPEYPVNAVDQTEHLKAVADRLSRLGKNIRAAIDASGEFGDADAADIFTQVSRDVDKYLWFVESHLAG